MHALLIIGLAICLLFAGLYQKKIRKNWLAPSSFWALVCFLMVSVPLTIVSFSQVSAVAIMWILLSTLCVGVGGAIALRYTPCESMTSDVRYTRFPGLALLIVAGSFAGAAALFIQFRMVGFSPLEVLFTNKFFTIMQELRPFHLQNKVPAYVSAMTGGMYLAAMLGGFYFVARERTVKRFIAILPFVPAVATAHFVTTKLSFLFPLLFWIGSYLAAHVYFGRLITKKTMIRFMIIAIIICLLMILLIISRWLSWAPRVGQPLFGGWIGFWKYTFTMVAGHIVAFSHWFPAYIQNIPDGYGWGRYTFAGIFNYLGFAARMPAENVVLFTGPGNNTSNVYTVFRPLILDYGLFGSLCVLFASGFCAERAFCRLKNGSIRWIPVLAAFYWITLWNYNTSIFNYNSILLAFFFFTGYFLLIPSINKLNTLRRQK